MQTKKRVILCRWFEVESERLKTQVIKIKGVSFWICPFFIGIHWKLRKTELRTELRSEHRLFLVRKQMVRKEVRSESPF